VLPRVPAALQAARVFDVSRSAGNKAVRGTGRARLADFADFALGRAEPALVVAGHSLWFRSFFDEFLPAGAAHDARERKIRTGGVVACVLERGVLPSGHAVLVVRPESVRVVHRGFDLKRARRPAAPKLAPLRAAPPAANFPGARLAPVLSPLKAKAA
jgi:hypothetical protein